MQPHATMKRPGLGPGNDEYAKRRTLVAPQDGEQQGTSAASTKDAEVPKRIPEVNAAPDPEKVPAPPAKPDDLDPGAAENLRCGNTQGDARDDDVDLSLKEGEMTGDMVMLSQDRRNPALFLFTDGDDWKILRLQGDEKTMEGLCPWDPDAAVVELLRAVVALNTVTPEDESQDGKPDGVLLKSRSIGVLSQNIMKATLRTINAALLPTKA